MKAAKKATLVLLMAIGTAAPIFSVQAATPTISAPAVSSQYVGTVTQASTQSADTVLKFSSIKNADLVKKYPVLKDEVAQIEHEDIGENIKTSIKIATYQDKTSHTNIVFLSLEGSAFCSSLGCNLKAYIDKGDGLKSALNVMAGEQVSLVANSGKIHLVLQGPSNPVQWDLQSGQFVFTKNLPVPPDTVPAPK